MIPPPDQPAAVGLSDSLTWAVVAAVRTITAPRPFVAALLDLLRESV